MDNITIITDKNFTDYHLGFEVQLSKKEFISWDMTYDEIFALPYVKSVIDAERGIYDYHYFKYPVRVGNFLFPCLKFSYNNENRRDVAVMKYFSSTINLSENEKLYEKIKIKLAEDLNQKQANSDLERGFFHLDGILFTIFFCKDDNHLAFYMTNARDYPDTDRYRL